jgi:hypothetical protein
MGRLRWTLGDERVALGAPVQVLLCIHESREVGNISIRTNQVDDEIPYVVIDRVSVVDEPVYRGGRVSMSLIDELSSAYLTAPTRPTTWRHGVQQA